ncbi:MAG: hypothetical protein KGD63_01215 [Candidatus Lokiarchaeota archaeon]|nr:hypothetical protein [Candidatus Lokiarchaeota archaeon]
MNSQDRYLIFGDGQLLIFYANDTEGYIASEIITIIKDTSSDSSIPSYPLMIMLSIIAITIVSLVIFHRRKNKFRLFN